MESKQKELVENLTRYYANKHPELKPLIQNIITETIVQCSLLSIKDIVSPKTLRQTYKQSHKSLSDLTG